MHLCPFRCWQNQIDRAIDQAAFLELLSSHEKLFSHGYKTNNLQDVFSLLSQKEYCQSELLKCTNLNYASC